MRVTFLLIIRPLAPHQPPTGCWPVPVARTGRPHSDSPTPKRHHALEHRLVRCVQHDHRQRPGPAPTARVCRPRPATAPAVEKRTCPLVEKATCPPVEKPTCPPVEKATCLQVQKPTSPQLHKTTSSLDGKSTCPLPCNNGLYSRTIATPSHDCSTARCQCWLQDRRTLPPSPRWHEKDPVGDSRSPYVQGPFSARSLPACPKRARFPGETPRRHAISPRVVTPQRRSVPTLGWQCRNPT